VTVEHRAAEMIKMWEALQAVDSGTQHERRFRAIYLALGCLFLFAAVIAGAQHEFERFLGILTVGFPIGGIGLAGLRPVSNYVRKYRRWSTRLTGLRRRWAGHPESVLRSASAVLGCIFGLATLLVGLASHGFTVSSWLTLLMTALIAGTGYFHWQMADRRFDGEVDGRRARST
jgi:hypothetical protein